MATKKTIPAVIKPSVKKRAPLSSVIPAPWTLRGRGYLFLYKDLGEEFLRTFVPADYKEYLGGYASLMVVDYLESPVGPYRELLFIPGKFKIQEWERHLISKIYVNTEASVTSGKANWAIPKELAHITFEREGKQEKILVTKEKKKVFELTVESGWFPFPLSTRLLPFPLTQIGEKELFLTRFSGRGWGRQAKILSMAIDPALFPDVSKAEPYLAIKVEPFKITFPKPIIVPR